MIQQIAHTAYMVSDMQKTLDFYCGKLGFTHAFSIANDEGKPWIEYVKAAPGQFIEFFYPHPGLQNNSGSYMHLCLQSDDIYADAARFEANGIHIRVQPNVGKDGNTQAWIDDPDGNQIELMQISPDSPQAKA